MRQRMYIESLIMEKSDPSGGYSSYHLSMSTISAALPDTLILQKT